MSQPMVIVFGNFAVVQRRLAYRQTERAYLNAVVLFLNYIEVFSARPTV